MGNGTTRFTHKYDSYFCALPKLFLPVFFTHKIRGTFHASYIRKNFKLRADAMAASARLVNPPRR
jgi:hypothetical protein